MAVLLTGCGKEVLVDDDDAVKFKGYKLRFNQNYVQGYRAGGRKVDILHRAIMGVLGDRSVEVDHINHNTLDNRKNNLRLCSRSQNQANQRLVPKNKSGFKGVSWHNQALKWQASIKLDGKSRNLGVFARKEDAALAYDAAASASFGEFALTNKQLGLL